jgi:adenylate cyclase
LKAVRGREPFLDSPEQGAATTILFADVSGSTRLYESAGDALAHAAIESCIAIFREKTQHGGGRVIKTIGDEVMSVFPDASGATIAAAEIQTAIQELAPVAGTKIGVRIGFHYGPVVERDGDVFGDAVNLAARLAGLAAKGQIMTSRETVERMTASQKAFSRRLYSIEVKGKAHEVDLYEVLWQQSGEETAMATRSEVARQPTKLKLKYMGQEIILDGTRTSLTLGRDRFADVTIVDRMGSRLHGKIEYRLGKFVLGDHSANGTYVTFENEPEIVLRREEVVLRNRGSIAFGQSRQTATEVAEFSCE